MISIEFLSRWLQSSKQLCGIALDAKRAISMSDPRMSLSPSLPLFANELSTNRFRSFIPSFFSSCGLVVVVCVENLNWRLCCDVHVLCWQLVTLNGVVLWFDCLSTLNEPGACWGCQWTYYLVMEMPSRSITPFEWNTHPSPAPNILHAVAADALRVDCRRSAKKTEKKS